jgi:hypothetical protein
MLVDTNFHLRLPGWSLASPGFSTKPYPFLCIYLSCRSSSAICWWHLCCDGSTLPILVSYKKLQFRFDSLFCGHVQSSRPYKWYERKIKFKAVTTNHKVIIVMLLNMNLPTELPRTSLIPWAHYLCICTAGVRQKFSHDPTTLSDSPLSCAHLKIISEHRTLSQLIFTRLEPDSGCFVFLGVNFRICPMINQIWLHSGWDVMLIRQLRRLWINLGSVTWMLYYLLNWLLSHEANQHSMLEQCLCTLPSLAATTAVTARLAPPWIHLFQSQ